jgi:hypothetical protein
MTSRPPQLPEIDPIDAEAVDVRAFAHAFDLDISRWKNV